MHLSISKKWGYLFIFVMLGGFYITYPYITLWSISEAIQTHNTKKLLKCLDWNLIKENMQIDLSKTIQNTATPQDELPDFGNSFATTAISNAVEHNLTPDNLTRFITHMKQDASGQNVSNLNALLQSFMATHIRFSSLTTLKATIMIPGQEENEPIGLTMNLTNWRWKVTSFQFSEKRTFQFFQLADSRN